MDLTDQLDLLADQADVVQTASKDFQENEAKMERMVKEVRWVLPALMDYVDKLVFAENLDQMELLDLME